KYREPLGETKPICNCLHSTTLEIFSSNNLDSTGHMSDRNRCLRRGDNHLPGFQNRFGVSGLFGEGCARPHDRKTEERTYGEQDESIPRRRPHTQPPFDSKGCVETFVSWVS